MQESGIHKRWTEYCNEQYNFKSNIDDNVVNNLLQY